MASIHGQDLSALTKNGMDLFLNAANNVRMWAEMKHNFTFTQVRAAMRIDGMVGTPLSSAIIDNDVEESILCSGTLSPNVVGQFVRNGNWGIRPLYIIYNLALHQATFCFYSTFYNSYIVSQTLNNAVQTNYWIPSPIQDFPLGTYTPQGSNTGTLTMGFAQYSTWNGLKEVIAVMRTNEQGIHVPLDFTRADIPIERDRTTRELSDNYWYWNRFPSDADILNIRGDATIIQRRQALFIYPSPTQVPSPAINVSLEAYAWLAPYTSIGMSTDPDQDFLCTIGAEFYQWRIAAELNIYFKTFVPRTEGNLADNDLQTRAASVWNELIAWDQYQINNNATRSR